MESITSTEKTEKSVVISSKWLLFVLIATFFVFNGTDTMAESPETDKNMLNDYQPEVQKLLETTYLGHAANFPDSEEPAAVLRKYLETNRHRMKTPQIQEFDQEITEWEVLIKQYPKSRHAQLGLAKLYKEKADLTGDSKLLRKAADLYQQAADIGLEHGRILYTHELSEFLVKLDEKAQFDKIFERFLATPKESNRKHYYLALVDYADGLTRFHDDERAWAVFDQAIEFYPQNNIEAINRYTGYLLERGKWGKALEILSRLTPEQRIWEVTPAIFRKKALTMMGLDTSSADDEIKMIQEHLTVGGPGPKHWILASSPATQPNDLAIASSFSHDVADDDCRAAPMNAALCLCPTQPDMYPGCPGCYGYFYPQTVNAAEILWNEARGESKGAQDMVAWTLSDRAAQRLSCDYYPGSCPMPSQCTTIPCTCVTNCDGVECSGCIDPGQQCNDCNSTQCSHMRKLCCVEHGGTTEVGSEQFQFNDTHVACADLCSSGVLWEAAYTLSGMVPDMSNTDWVPAGHTSCDYNCTRPKCYPLQTRSLGLNASPKGPMEYRGYNYCTAKSTEKCKLYSKNVCGQISVPNNLKCSSGGYDGDNFFWNVSRVNQTCY